MDFTSSTTIPPLICSSTPGDFNTQHYASQDEDHSGASLPPSPDHLQTLVPVTCWTTTSPSTRHSQLQTSLENNRQNSVPRRRMCSRNSADSPVLPWSGIVLLMATMLLAPASAQHQAKVDSSQCSYTLVVNEFDVSKCPVMLADARSAQEDSQNVHPKDLGGKGSVLSKAAAGGGGTRRDFKQGVWGSVAEDKEEERVVGVLKSQVRDLEDRLLQEMVRSRQLNSTVGRHDTALAQAETQLAAYHSNFTALYRAMIFVQRQLKRQRKVNKSLNKKLSNVMLDVVEVNNVLTRVPTSPQDGAKATAKTFNVQSVAKVRSCPGVTEQSSNFVDCAAVFAGGHRQSGVYYVRPRAAACPVPVWCDMDTTPGGWLLFQRRQDGSVDFNRHWDDYRDGFGSVAGEHWLGNDNLFLLTNQDHYQLRVDLWDFSGNRVHALYSTFRVAGERDLFQLTLSGHSGSAQDSLHRHNRMSFSAPDRDHDGRPESHCAAEWEAGWWFNNCWFALLNGAYHNRSDVAYRGIAWNHWKREQLRKSEMKMRPVAIRPKP